MSTGPTTRSASRSPSTAREAPAALGIDLAAVPVFAAVIEVRAGRQAMVRDYLTTVTQELLDARSVHRRGSRGARSALGSAST